MNANPRALGRSPLSRRTLLGASALSTMALLAVACSDGPHPSGSGAVTPCWGAFMPNVLPPAGSSADPVDRLSAVAGAPPRLLHRFAAIGDSLPVAELDAINAAGATALLTLEPWEPGAGLSQPSYSLRRIALGSCDAELRRWGTEIATWGGRLLLRFAQEMNGTWYPWAVGVNANTTSDYRDAWTHVRSIISAAAPHTVRYVWAPNVHTAGTTSFADAYPGPDQVDVVGLDGYNWGNVVGHRWQSARELFDASIADMQALAPGKPLLLTEVGCADGEHPEDKAQWIRDFFAVLAVHRNGPGGSGSDKDAGFLWFQVDKERDWRFNSSPQSLAAFRQGLTALQASH